MISSTMVRPFALLAHTAVFAVCCVGIVCIAAKPGLGIQYEESDDRIVCTAVLAAGSGFTPGDRIVSIDGQQIRNVEDVEFLLDRMTIGRTVPCALESGDSLRAVAATLVPYYGTAYLVIVVFVSALFFGVGVFVSMRRPGDRAARMFHLGSLGTAVMLSTTWGQYWTDPPVWGIGLRVLFSAMYALVPVLFLHFTSLFPRDRTRPGSLVVPGLYALAAILAAASGLTFVRAAASGLVSDFHHHLQVFTATRWFLVALVAGGLLSVRHAYLTAGEEAERRRLRWVVWGLFVGFVPFVALWVIPSIVLSYGLVPEEVMLFFSGAIPLSFGISIVRYRLLDIDLLLSRSVAYTIVTAILITVYLTLVVGGAAMVATFTYESSLLISAGAAVLVALAFEPLRRLVQHQVDRRYFRVRYDYRRATAELLNEIRLAPSEQLLATKLVDRLAALIPAGRLAFIACDTKGGSPSLLSHRGEEVPDLEAATTMLAGRRDGAPRPVAAPDAVEHGDESVPDDGVLSQRSLAVALPLLSKEQRVLGFLVLGPKESGRRFSSEDMDLLRGVATQTGLEMERLRLQKQLIITEEEASRLLTLNALKSDFVSYVSHDLRTPLTSIKLYTELLRGRVAAGDKRAREYLAVVEGEADRLNRMVTTILDSASIEEGALRYTLRDMDLLQTIRRVVRLMKYQLQKEGFRVEVRIGRQRGGLRIVADQDAVGEALLNLLTNAMKYSPGQKVISLSAGRRGKEVICTVRDRGAGISPEALPHIFDKFYRDPALPRRVQGLGIGLSVVKHIMDVHGGRIEVESAPGKGTSFTLVFPPALNRSSRRSHEDDSGH